MTSLSNYCPNRAWEMSMGEIKFPSEHQNCGRKECWALANTEVFTEEDELNVSLILKIYFVT